MPIKNLTTQQALAKVRRNIPRAGKFRHGEEKKGNRPGQNLKDGSWRVTFDEGYEYIQPLFEQIIPDTSEPIIIAMIGNSVDECLDDYYRHYGSNNVAKRLCDGDNIIFQTGDNKDSACLGCPARREADQKAKDDCTPSGYFRFTIPLLTKALRHEVMFQIDITSKNELQQFAKELEVTLNIKGSLINQLFVLNRKDRIFNRDGQKNVQPLAYLSAFDFDLLEKANASQKMISQSPDMLALPAGDPINDEDEPINDETYYEKYVEAVTLWSERYIGRSIDDWILYYSDGGLKTINDLYQQVPDLTQLELAFVDFAVKKGMPLKVYGFATKKINNSTAFGMNFGFGKVYGYSRAKFSDTLEPIARKSYFAKSDPSNERNLKALGNHSCMDLFNLEFVHLILKYNGNGNLEVSGIYHPEQDIPF